MKPQKQKSIKELQKDVDWFNGKYKVGTFAMIENDEGEVIARKVLSEAQILGNHSAVGWFEGIKGCYSLDCVCEP